jgi:predicted double-glycine peptidase
MQMKRFAFAILLILILGRPRELASQESAGVWLDVPFVKQTEDGCGSAAISMLLQYWTAHGTSAEPVRADAAAIQKRLYSRKARGILASDMQSYLQETGFQVFAIEGQWKDLQEQLTQGRPLIISMQPGSVNSPLHYVVVTGMDWRNGAVFVHDPARGKLIRVERAEFEKEWRPNHNWLLLAVPKKAA